MLLRNGRIAQVGPSKKVKVPAGAQVVRCTGKTLITGLLMLHEHLYYTMPAGGFFNIAQMPYPFPRLQKRENATWQQNQGKHSASVALFKKGQAWEKQFYDAGGLLVAGTNPTGAGRTLAGYANRHEIELLVEGGFTPLEAIKICALNGARCLGRDKDIGAIEAGKQADLVLVNGDPERDTHQLRRTEIVFKHGVGFDSPKLFESMKGKVGLN